MKKRKVIGEKDHENKVSPKLRLGKGKRKTERKDHKKKEQKRERKKRKRESGKRP